MKICGGFGTAAIPTNIQKDLRSVAKILNIEWFERGIEDNAMIICPRNSNCPRDPECVDNSAMRKATPDLDKIRVEIIGSQHK